MRLVSDRVGMIIAAVLLGSYFVAAMVALFSRRGKQRYGDANARGWMMLVATLVAALATALAIGAFFQISWLIGIVCVLAVLPAVTIAYNVLVDLARKVRKKIDTSRPSDG